MDATKLKPFTTIQAMSMDFGTVALSEVAITVTVAIRSIGVVAPDPVTIKYHQKPLLVLSGSD